MLLMLFSYCTLFLSYVLLQWSVDGRYVVVNWTLCEADRGEHRKALSIFKRVKDTTSLRRLLCFHGFKKIARSVISPVSLRHRSSSLYF